VDEALDIARQIAEGVAEAHQRGIIHRDLKPANIKQTPDGKVKVLDFGLAKAFESGTATMNKAESPTLLSARTQPNVLLGTASYMSPEQVRGKPADEQSDVWAFGCVVYEMLTAKRLFDGESVADIIGAITQREPDWSALPEATSPHVHRMLRRCLQKDRARRLHHIADARIEIEEALREPETRIAKTISPFGLAGIAAAAAAGAVLMFTGLYFLRDGGAEVPQLRLEVSTLPTSDMSVAISPDARSLVFVVASQGKSQLWIRSLASVTPRPLAGTEDAIFPFWSPDSRSIGFFAQSQLRRVEVGGGPPQTLATSGESSRGAAWAPDGTILFSSSSGPLFRTTAGGATPAAVTQLETGQGSHRFPHFLPDGRHFLYFAVGKPEVSGIYVASLDSSGSKRLLDSDTQAVYAHPGFLLFLRQGTLLSQRFDPKTLELSGEPMSIAEQVTRIRNATGSAAISSAANGTVAYRTSLGNDSRLVWVDRMGKELGTIGPPGAWFAPELSSDSKHVVLHRAINGKTDIWSIEIARGLPRRLTTDPADDEMPIWSPDGSRILFTSARKGAFDLYQMPFGGGATDTLLSSSEAQIPASWSPDGRYILYWTNPNLTNLDLWALPLFGDRKPFPVANSNFDESLGQFSPDMKWIAFQSNESGRFEIYAQPFPASNGRRQISTDGGAQPRWRRDGKELFYVAPNGDLMAVPLAVTSSGLEPGTPVRLFQTPRFLEDRQFYDVATDGRRFLLSVPIEAAPLPITLLMNWAPAAAK